MIFTDKNRKINALVKTLFFLRGVIGYRTEKAVRGNEIELRYYYDIYQNEENVSSDKDCGINFCRGCSGDGHIDVLIVYSIDDVDGGFWHDLTLFSSQKHQCDESCGTEVEDGCGRFNKGFFYYQPVDS
jgi:hypothetical protein